MGKSFRQRLLAVLDERRSRFIYFEADDRHYIVCKFTEFDDTQVLQAMIENMRDNPSLVVMEKDVDYRWEGSAMISFRSKGCAAAFYICCPA